MKDRDKNHTNTWTHTQKISNIPIQFERTKVGWCDMVTETYSMYVKHNLMFLLSECEYIFTSWKELLKIL